MKEDGLVLVTEDDGSLPIGETSPLGLYYHDTQFLSGFALRINGQPPALLSANTEQNYVGAFQLANRPATLDDGTILPSQSLSVRRTRFLADGLRERVGILNCNPAKVRVRIELEFGASFRDMFVVRGYRGLPPTVEATPVEVIPNGIRFQRLGRDGVRRTTDVTMRPAPDRIDGNTFVLERELAPQEIVTYELAVANPDEWTKIRGSKPAAVFGSIDPVEPEAVNASVEILQQKYAAGRTEHAPTWAEVLSRPVPDRVDDTAWARIVFDFLRASKVRPTETQRYVGALVPLYFARVASFIEEARALDTEQAEALVERQAAIFEKLKPELIAGW